MGGPFQDERRHKCHSFPLILNLLKDEQVRNGIYAAPSPL